MTILSIDQLLYYLYYIYNTETNSVLLKNSQSNNISIFLLLWIYKIIIITYKINTFLYADK